MEKNKNVGKYKTVAKEYFDLQWMTTGGEIAQQSDINRIYWLV